MDGRPSRPPPLPCPCGCTAAGRFADAERELLCARQGLGASRGTATEENRKRLVELYERWGRPAEAGLQTIAMRHETMTTTYVIVLGLEAVTAFLLGVVFLNDGTSLAKLGGIGLIVGGIFLLKGHT